MKALARLEAILQDLMERPQRLLAPNRVHPLALAAALTRSFEAHVIPLADREIAPNEFTLRLHPQDFAQLAPVRRTLERELGGYVSRAADERGLTLPASPKVELIEDSAVRAGAVEVDAEFGEAPRQQVTSVTSLQSAAGFTERMDRAALASLPAPDGHAAVDLLSDNGRVLRSFSLDAPIVTIGRRSGNNIPLLDVEVSRQHARIDFVPPRYFVTDLGSTNGTRLNGRAVKGREALRDGDVIEIGRQQLRFRHRGEG
jgi:predicted component of type VI protein secretion system